MSRGRPPTGPRLVDGMPGSALAKRRLRLILETVAGERSIPEVCAELGIGEAAFHKMRSRFLAHAVSLLEPQPVGRPREGPDEEDPTRAALEAEVRELHLDLEAARIREELAIVMPQVLRAPENERARKKKRRKSR